MIRLLAEGWTADGPLDLSEVLAIVPTRQSGRRLREALAEHAAGRGAAVFPPRVMLPESLVEPAPGRNAASRLEMLLAWVQVFRELPLDEFREVFPVDPPARNFDWALQLADEFVRLQRSLAEAGVRLAEVASLAGDDFPETERWRQIGRLERLHDRQLEAFERVAAPAARIAQSRHPDLPAGIRRILVIATPDPQPIALRALAALAPQVPVEIVVFAPPSEADAFDAWGRPQPPAWAARVLALPEFVRQVHLCADPAAQAGRIAAVAGCYDEPDRILSVGVADPEVLPLVESALAHAGIEAFSPEGRPRRGDRLFQLLQALARLAREESFAVVESLARCPDFLAFLTARIGPGFSAARFLRSLDRLHAKHLPPTLHAARQQIARRLGSSRHEPGEAPNEPAATTGGLAMADPPSDASAEEAQAPATGAARSQRPEDLELEAALPIIAELRARLTAGAFPANAGAVLADIFDAPGFDSGRSIDDTSDVEAAEAWTDILREIADARIRPNLLATADGWQLALQLYGETVAYDDKPARALELQGWLELLWEDAAHLVIAGMNDGRVPEAIVGDRFLPESLRERLGLKTNAARFARDAYFLQALAASRGGEVAGTRAVNVASGAAPDGEARIDLLLGKTSVAGEPLRPSRLLLRCADEELPERIRFLFRAVAPAGTLPSWRRAWRLRPPRKRASEPVVERVAVTALRAWLACPFRFYLSRVLKMETVDPAKTELDVFDFGTLCHGALEAMGRAPELRDETRAKIVREFLLAELEAQARRRFGSQLTLPLVVQLESARQRLGRLAEVQAQTRAEGWVIEHVERPFEIEVAGLVVTGKIDRIDRHENTGALRVLDYKTSDRPVSPAQAHLRGLRHDAPVREFARMLAGGKEQQWVDLQLPLYLRALVADPALGAGAVPLACGYFNLPKAIAETGILSWEGFTRELEEAAWSCAEGVAEAIRRGEFWPPNELIRPEHDDFASLFHHGAADSVDWEAEE